MTKIGVEVSASCTSKEVGYGRLATMGILWRIDDLAPRNGSAVRACPRQRSVVPLGEVEPAIEVADTPAAVIVKAQVPGVSKEHLQVNVTDTTLTLKGEVQEDKTTEDKHYHRREFHYRGVRADHHTPDDRPGGASYRSTQGRRLGGDDSEAGGDHSQRRTDSDLRAPGREERILLLLVRLLHRRLIALEQRRSDDLHPPRDVLKDLRKP